MTPGCMSSALAIDLHYGRETGSGVSFQWHPSSPSQDTGVRERFVAEKASEQTAGLEIVRCLERVLRSEDSDSGWIRDRLAFEHVCLIEQQLC